MNTECWVTRICIWNGKWKQFFSETLPALRASDKALERQEVCYFQQCSGERSLVHVAGHREWDWHDTCLGQLWPLTKSRIKCLIIGRAAAESPEEQWRLRLAVSTLLFCVYVNLKEKVRRVPFRGLETCAVNCEDGSRRHHLLRTGVHFEVGKTKYPKSRNHGSWRRNGHHTVWRCSLGFPTARGFRAKKTPSSVKGRTLRYELWWQSCFADITPTEMEIYHYC